MAKLPIIDSHIHLDSYDSDARLHLLAGLAASGVEGVIAVSMDLASCYENRRLQRKFPRQVYPAYGYHPEQPVLPARELDLILTWIRANAAEMAAVGEVGLPYYLKLKSAEQGIPFDPGPYVHQLDRFIALAAELNKPVVLHAIYDDAAIACGLLERHGIAKAQFHWFKGSDTAAGRIIANGYFISFTPDIVYEPEIQHLAGLVPIEQMLIETDGPWPFAGPFTGLATHPRFLTHTINKIAEIKNLPASLAAERLYQNTQQLFAL